VGVLTVVLGLLLGAPPARADWDAGYLVPMAPRSVEAWGPGTFSVSTTMGNAYLFEGGGSPLSDGGIAWTRTLNGESAGTFLTADGCFVSVLMNGGTRVSNLPDGGTSCVPGSTIIASPSYPRVWSVKHVPNDGGSFAVASSLSSPFSMALLYSPAGVGSSGSWDSRVTETSPRQPTGALGVTQADGGAYALLGLDGGPPPSYLRGGSSTASSFSVLPQTPSDGGWVLSIELFPGEQSVPHALIGTTSGLLRGHLGSDGGSLAFLPLPLTGNRRVPAVELDVESGSPYGMGFGMAILQGDEFDRLVLRAQPVRDPSQVGTRWYFFDAGYPEFLQRSGVEHLSCRGGQTCVAATGGVPGRLYVYTNAHAPSFALDASVELDESSSLPLTLSAKDDDEEPVLVSLVSVDSRVPGWSMEQLNPEAVGDTVELQFTAGAVCETREVGSFVAAASDGWRAHDQVKNVKVFVRHTQVLPAPELVNSSYVMAAGQDGGLVVQASTPATLCPPEGWRWQLTSANTRLALAVDGGTAVFTAPEHLCVAGGETYTYQAIAYDSAGDSPPTPFAVRLEPWGRPSPPFDPAAGPVLVNLDAGQSHTLRPQLTHVCASAADFPDLVTRWSLEGSVPAGITFLDVAGNGVTLPVSMPELTVATEDCVDAQLPLRVVHRMGDSGLEGPSSTVTVSVATQLIPFSQGQLLLQEVEKHPTQVSGRVGTNLNCTQRRNVSARLRLVRETGEEVSRQTVSVPGTWSLPLPEDCAGGRFRVEGRLVDEFGAEAGSATESVEMPALPVTLDALPEGTRMVAQCGQGARTTLAQTYPMDSCPLSQVTWTWKEGPRLTWDSISGSQVELATQDTGLMELVGRTVKLEVTGLAVSGEERTEAREVPITTKPFLELLHRAELPTASDTGLVGFSATLTNTTECGVREVSLTEQLDGLAYVEGSARLDGVPVAAQWANGRLTVSGLSVGPRASAQLTYVVRPGLLGNRQVRGQAFLRDIPISLPEASSPEVPDSGCGCTSGTPGPLLFALGALAVAVRRRRARVTGRS
jgi:MYXO-CTERM domain-containing protein